MKIFSFEEIKKLNIHPNECMLWVEEAFRQKHLVNLPNKKSITFNNGSCFFNTMPCLFPPLNKFGVKEVSRYPNRNSSISGEILLYNLINGDLLCLMDANWITSMRTGAVAALSIKHLRSTNAKIFSFLGLGNTARATMLCLLENEPEHNFLVRLLKHKDQAEQFIERFKDYKNCSFEIVSTKKELIQNADVIVSAVTIANDLIGEDSWFKEGVLVVPIHTRGFQNCDLFFDKVYADDTDHVVEFKYFNKFKKFDEFANVLIDKHKGRLNDKERILIYNIGLAMFDIYFASQIYDRLEIQNKNKHKIQLRNSLSQFWV
ncbi:ornithine cyclodeaminase/alanine dehydrogenase-like protein (mu-crystallin family) [Dysgonomonadaceae bacterium PH5-43]|nr:ornithine cyclodeaminase/alanine dehydrogenase-like protein (mu-crystallin family) [Dysgonomonadaceae bacterium PH5-43]